MKKSLVITATALLLFVGCTEEKKEQTTSKQELVQTNEKKAEEVKQKEIKVEEQKKVETSKVEEKKLEEPKAAETKKEEVTQTIAVVNDSDGETLFKTCTSCHGQKAEKEALGKSQVIAGWDKDRVIKALNGYKDGSYGGVMKGIMKPHVESKTPEQISALADFISKL